MSDQSRTGRGLWRDRRILRLLCASASMDAASAMVVTSVSLFLVTAVHVAPAMAGFFFFGRGAAEILANLSIGMLSDRFLNRRALLALCSLLSAFGALSYLWLRNYYALLAAGAVFFGIGAMSLAQTFAYTREFAEAYRYPATAVNSVLRTVTSGSWVVGPPAGFYILSRYGFGAMYTVAAALFLLGAVLSRFGLPDVPALVHEKRDGHYPFARIPARVWLLLGAVVLLVIINQMYQIDMALYVTKMLHLGLAVPGLLLGTAAAFEIPAIMIIGSRADRLGKPRLVLAASVCAVGFFAALPFATSLPALLLLQIPNALWTCVVLNLPLVILMDKMPDRPGAASSLYASSFQAGMLLGGGFTAAAITMIGYTNVFFACLGIAGAAALLLVLYHRADMMTVQRPLLGLGKAA
jgi:MFS transporter, SET family, sugar efflux transporter